MKNQRDGTHSQVNANYDMKKDPALCRHGEISKSARVDRITVPELGIEQLVLRVRVFCKHCKEPFVMKTLADGFSTDEIGWADGDLIVPLDYPLEAADDESEMESATPDPIPTMSARQTKEQLH